ncbi:hypothetical protein GCM10010921_31110 [Microbacterium album]|uniref:Enoyl-CoA hydratase n=1 Tax=Microbacterium album TaxID=2053191 RepID=A0A917MQM4_9MICO|nr:hypothetical protein GCM10010921_31110 [Microbacterium album]
MLAGRHLPAREAASVGLVSRLVAPADLERETQRMAGQIAGRSLAALYAAKSALRATRETGLQQNLLLERALFGSLFSGED